MSLLRLFYRGAWGNKGPIWPWSRPSDLCGESHKDRKRFLVLSGHLQDTIAVAHQKAKGRQRFLPNLMDGSPARSLLPFSSAITPLLLTLHYWFCPWLRSFHFSTPRISRPGGGGAAPARRPLLVSSLWLVLGIHWPKFNLITAF